MSRCVLAFCAEFPHERVCGWYFKCQNGRQTLAVIPAEHGCGRERGCSVQLMFDGGVGFTGVVGAELWHGKEYRLATYLGARVERIGQGEVMRQRGLRLTARLREPAGQPCVRRTLPLCMNIPGEKRCIHENEAGIWLYRELDCETCGSGSRFFVRIS